MKVKVKVPATSANLGPGLDVLGLALNIYNYIEMEVVERGLTIEVSGEGSNELGTDEANLVYQAAKKVFQRVGQAPSGLYIKQHNDIPLTRGLGSSAAAIIGGLVAANHIMGAPLSQDELLNIANSMEGHPDNVAPALLGGFVVSCEVGQSVKYVRVVPEQGLIAVLAIPDFQLSTSKARAVLPPQVTRESALFNTGRAAMLVAAFCTSQYELISCAMEDRLHQNYRAQLIPGFSQVMEAAKQAGALGAALSGAGPTILALTAHNEEQVGQALNRAFLAHNINNRIVVTDICPLGAQVLV